MVSSIKLFLSITSSFLPHVLLSSSPHLDDLCHSLPLLTSCPCPFPFTKQQSPSFHINLTFLIPPPSANQHCAHIPHLIWSFSVVLSVSGTGAPDLSSIFLTVSDCSIVLLVHFVNITSAVAWPHCPFPGLPFFSTT